jgi:hypothetical protein
LNCLGLQISINILFGIFSGGIFGTILHSSLYNLKVVNEESRSM